MKSISAMKQCAALCVLALIATVTMMAQTPAAKKPLTFNGKVEALTKPLRV